MAWRPLSVRDDPDKLEAYEALHEGVPEWLFGPIQHWVEDLFSDVSWEDIQRHVSLMAGLLRRPFPTNPRDAVAQLSLNAASGDLDVLDACVFIAQFVPEGQELVDRLGLLLLVHGSAWTVDETEEGQWCLQRRVDETVETAVRSVMDQPGNAGRHLHRAWDRAFGLRPDPGSSYREAVRAVEAAALPVVTPKDPKATLGTMLGALRAKPEKWTVVLNEGGTTHGVNLLIGMLQGLWKSQFDRHGSADESIPLDVSRAEAEAAVLLSVTLVQWFRSGAVSLVDDA